MIKICDETLVFLAWLAWSPAFHFFIFAQISSIFAEFQRDNSQNVCSMNSVEDVDTSHT